MKRLGLIVVLLGLMLAACDDEDGDDANGIVLQNDSGAFITLAVKDEFKIVLEANPSTGYQWEIDPDASGTGVVDPVGEASFESESDLPGSGGKQTFTFEATGDGSVLLRLRYWRSFEPDATPLRMFEVNVTVETE